MISFQIREAAARVERNLLLHSSRPMPERVIGKRNVSYATELDQSQGKINMLTSGSTVGFEELGC